VEYPERLSRRLVLIKSWLLAIPHYLIVAIPLGAIWSVSTDDGDGLLYASADGLIGLLVLFATAALLFTAPNRSRSTTSSSGRTAGPSASSPMQA